MLEKALFLPVNSILMKAVSQALISKKQKDSMTVSDQEEEILTMFRIKDKDITKGAITIKEEIPTKDMANQATLKDTPKEGIIKVNRTGIIKEMCKVELVYREELRELEVPTSYTSKSKEDFKSKAVE